MSKKQSLWQPASERITSSTLSRFQAFVEARNGCKFDDYGDLHRWSVTELAEFWQSVWDFTGVRATREADSVLVDEERFPGARWFQGARLNYAENLLNRRDSGAAIIGRLENGDRRELSWSELYEQVALAASALRESGVQKGDRVAGMLPNIPETIVAMLATASLGALWSSCSPDFGVSGVLDRFGQIQPKVLIACDGYHYNGKTIDCTEKVSEVASQLELSATVVVPILGVPVDGAVSWPSYLRAQQTDSGGVPELHFEQLPFDHPLFIMYSSGTTGAPKCIVHSAGGTLLQHLKEHQLHVGLAPKDVLFYFTTCGWMMWNWMVGGLATGATLVLYDGSPFYPAPDTLLDIVDDEGINVFGVGAKYISALEKQGLRPSETHKLNSLRTVLSTGSPLSHESFRYVYRDVKEDVCLSSISGGTDIISCFVLGNECLPVHEGELQCAGLGMAVEVWDEQGQPVKETKGEMVCVKPFPSAPVGFWNDPDGQRYHKAYFASYEGIWAHGDYAEFTPSGGMIIHGRSDAVLNPGGVRIGTAEIYRQVEKIEDVLDSVCIGQNWDDDVRVVLFVVLKEGAELTDELSAEIRAAIRRENTPRHVPAKILEVTDIPRTRSGKIAEIPVRKTVNGESIDNTESLSNPESLPQFRDRPELQV
ncbi:acetoacetate--CoA ligase [Congregibacter sp.]|uniref:acetoacetate--CoA ligase n=1 Tax=Congregibacter sp. TaxID=2744308 RepID=UPI00385DDB04